jgi:hypothetical protein
MPTPLADVVNVCCVKDPAARPLASELKKQPLFAQAAQRTALRPLAELAKQRRAEAAAAMPADDDEYNSDGDDWEVRFCAVVVVVVVVVVGGRSRLLCVQPFSFSSTPKPAPTSNGAAPPPASRAPAPPSGGLMGNTRVYSSVCFVQQSNIFIDCAHRSACSSGRSSTRYLCAAAFARRRRCRS